MTGHLARGATLLHNHLPPRSHAAMQPCTAHAQPCSHAHMRMYTQAPPSPMPVSKPHHSLMQVAMKYHMTQQIPKTPPVGTDHSQGRVKQGSSACCNAGNVLLDIPPDKSQSVLCFCTQFGGRKVVLPCWHIQFTLWLTPTPPSLPPTLPFPWLTSLIRPRRGAMPPPLAPHHHSSSPTPHLQPLTPHNHPSCPSSQLQPLAHHSPGALQCCHLRHHLLPLTIKLHLPPLIPNPSLTHFGHGAVPPLLPPPLPSHHPLSTSAPHPPTLTFLPSHIVPQARGSAATFATTSSPAADKLAEAGGNAELAGVLKQLQDSISQVWGALKCGQCKPGPRGECWHQLSRRPVGLGSH